MNVKTKEQRYFGAKSLVIWFYIVRIRTFFPGQQNALPTPFIFTGLDFRLEFLLIILLGRTDVKNENKLVCTKSNASGANVSENHTSLC